MKALFAHGVALGRAGTAFQGGAADPAAEIATGSVDRRAAQEDPAQSAGPERGRALISASGSGRRGGAARPRA